MTNNIKRLYTSTLDSAKKDFRAKRPTDYCQPYRKELLTSLPLEMFKIGSRKSSYHYLFINLQKITLKSSYQKKDKIFY